MDDRAEFEQWGANKRFKFNLVRRENGDDHPYDPQDAWEVWQAATARQRELDAQLCEENEVLLPIDDWIGTKKEFGAKIALALAEAIRRQP